MGLGDTVRVGGCACLPSTPRRVRDSGLSVLMMKWSTNCSGGHAVNRSLGVLVLSLLLASCGGGGGSSSETFTVSGTVTVTEKTASVTPLESAPVEVFRTLRAGVPGSDHPMEPMAFAGQVAAAGAGIRDSSGVEAVGLHTLELEKGQHIVLEFEDSDAALLHLYLLDELGAAVDASVDPVESPKFGFRNLSLLVPEDGRYVVRVFADRGNAKYSLLLYDRVSPMYEVRRGLRVSDEFVAHQVLVRSRAATSETFDSWANELGLRRLRAGHTPVELWEVDLGQGGRVLDGLRGWRPRSGVVVRWDQPELLARYETLLIARHLGLQPEVLSVSPNHRLRPQQVLPNDPRHPEQWFHWNIELPEAWQISTGFPNHSEVVVAVVDTGVFREHEDLEGRLLEGFDFVLNQSGGDDPGHGSSHGTHVTGIIGAASDNRKGVAGVSWGAMTLPVRALTDDSGTLSNLLEGIRYAARLPNASGTIPEHRADVINLSLGGDFPCNAAHNEFFQSIRNLGIFLVAASGNSPDGSASITFPASCDAVFSVGATDRRSRRAVYSNFDGGLDFVAPGGQMGNSQSPDGILSSIAPESSSNPETGYAFYQGTSMAAAVASGVLALAKAVDPSLTPDLFSDLLECGLLTDDLGSEGWDIETGWGQINALKTLRAVSDNRDGNVQFPAPSVDRIYVRLLNADGEAIATSAADPRGCRYPFRFENVPRGEYWIVAGTDPESDDWTQCIPGDLCGAYPELASPEFIRIDRDRSGLDFDLVPGG